MGREPVIFACSKNIQLVGKGKNKSAGNSNFSQSARKCLKTYPRHYSGAGNYGCTDKNRTEHSKSTSPR